ncbi:hypothetical protein BH10ACI1_BH10ACI1_30410 [soil metagenome]
MKKTKFVVLVLFLCGALAFQLFMPAELLNTTQSVEAKNDELSDTYWNIDGTIYALNFTSNGSVKFLVYNTKTDDFDTVARGTYRVRGDIVTMTFGGRSGAATISGKRRNKMTGKFYVEGKQYVIRATRADGE